MNEYPFQSLNGLISSLPSRYGAVIFLLMAALLILLFFARIYFVRQRRKEREFFVVRRGLEEEISRRKRLEEESERLILAEQMARSRAEASEQRFRDLINGLDAIVWEADVKSLQYTFVSRRAEEILGYSVDRWVREPRFWASVIHPDDQDRVLSLYRKAAEDGEEHCFEHRASRADGRIVWLQSAVYVVCEPEGQGERLRGVTMDITQRKQVEEERSQLLIRAQTARAEAEMADRLKDEFLATVSHELRTPLNAILGWAQILRGEVDQATQARGLETVERNARAQARLIDDILDVSRIITGKLRLDVKAVEFPVVIDAAVEAVRLAANAKEIKLDIVLDMKAGLVSGDPNRLQQIVWNLLSNAIKFTPRGGTVTVRLRPIGSQAELSVADTGCGIGAAFLPHVFDAFRQADASSSRKHSGLGLGLAIVRHLVELHGGVIYAESRGEGQGAVFTMSLPALAIREEDRRGDQAQGSSPKGASSPLAGLRVLVVDDERDARELVEALLSHCGAEVRTCASAAEAFTALQLYKPDVIISDIGMPEEDGFSLIRRVRALEPERGGRIPAIALTAYAGAADRVRVLSTGFQVFMPKPLEPVELVAVIKSLNDGVEAAHYSGERWRKTC